VVSVAVSEGPISGSTLLDKRKRLMRSGPVCTSLRWATVLFSLRPDLPVVSVDSRAEWRRWLARNHHQSTGVWVATFKKRSVPEGSSYVSAVDLNEECLCFGWIDSKPGKIDAQQSALLCSPRKPGSGWSKVNKDRLVRLFEAGLVAPAGLAAIERAKADGSWAKLDQVDALIVPEDLRAELSRWSDAATNFDAFPPSARRGILEWISQAKRPETRQARVNETARSAQDNKRANSWPK
jgi:uncharacterized protein YdeI (YjbR/CyaY-like superfamily)